jgi:glycosyltransferase involved in cell wall biosynthesis
LRILHVISSLDPRDGGTTTLIDALARAQKGAGLEVSVVSNFAAGFDDVVVRRLRDSGIPVELIGPNKHFLAWHPQISPTLRRLVPTADVVHIHALWEEIQHRAARVAHAAGRPYVFTPHGMLDPWSLRQSRLKKQIYLALRLRRDLNQASAIHYSDEAERDLVAPLKLRPRAFVLRHLLDLSEFEQLPPRGSFRRECGVPNNKLLLLFLSRLHPKKGLDLLLPAFASLRRDDVYLILAGPGPQDYVQTLRGRADELGITPRVIFSGMMAGPRRIAAFVDADLFVLPSYQENFGLVVIESLAAGTPVVISDQVNIHRQISTAEVGEVVGTNVPELAGALGRWLGNANLRAAAAERAKRFVAEQYDARTIAQQWVEFYGSLTAVPVSSPGV